MRRRAVHARALLEDPLIRAFFEQTRQDIFSEWSAATEPALREELWQRQRAIDAFQAYLYSNLAPGIDTDQTETMSGRN